MAAGEKKLPQFVDSYVPDRADGGRSKKWISRWKLTLLGSFAAFIVLKYMINTVPFDHWHWHGQQLARPHRIPPEVAEQAFL